MSKLTSKEKKWVSDLQTVLDRCPSRRLGFYTVGDDTVFLWDVEKADEVFSALDARLATDFGPAVECCSAGFDQTITFPNSVESTAG